MSNYTISVDWDGKDDLADSSAAKVISGDDFQTEFETVQTAINSKANLNGDSGEDFAMDGGTIAGNVTAPTQSAGNNTTRLATTAFVTTAVAAVDKSVINDHAYPVGSIYCTVATGDPATVLGVGTWEAFGSGRVMVGQQSSVHDSTGTGSDSDFNTREEMGGAKTGAHTLTTAEIPAHTHTVPKKGNGGSSYNLDYVQGGETEASSSTGGGGSHSHPILQPYIVVRMWKRTA
jgi:hypothetical protein